MRRVSNIIASLTICMTLLLAIVSQSVFSALTNMIPDSPSNPIEQAYGQSSGDYLTYENKAHGIQLKYPSDWERYDGVEEGSIVQFYSPFENDTDQYSENFGIYFDVIPAGMTLDEYSSAIINAYTRGLDSFVLISNSSITLANQPAYELVFTFQLTDDTGVFDLQSRNTLMIKDGRGYLFTYNSEESSYSLYLPLVENMLDSISLKPSTGPIDEEKDFLSFESTPHGIKIQYPSDWEEVEDPSMPSLIVKFVSPARNQFDYREEFQIFSERIPSIWNLDDYVKISTDAFERGIGTDLDIIESSTTSIDGRQAHKLVFSASVNGTDNKIKGIMLFTINRGTAFTFSFLTQADLYSGFSPTIETMIASFAFIRTQEQPIEPAQYLSYSNTTYSIQVVKYPDNWVLSEPRGTNATEVSFYSSNYDARVGVGYFDLALPQVSLSEYTDHRIKELMKRVSLFNLIDSNQTTLAGEPAQMIVYKGHLELIGDKLFPYKVMEIVAIKDGRAYVITYGTFEDRYSTYLPLAEKMIDSFQMDRTLAPKVLNKTYVDPELGLDMSLPEKWAGVQTEKSGVTVVVLSAEDASLDSDYSSMVIVSGSDADLGAYFDKNSNPSVTCNSDRTFEIVNLAGAKAVRYETTCDDPDFPKYFTYYLRGADESVYVFYESPNDAIYSANLAKFQESVSSMKLSSSVDLSDIGEYAKYNGLEEQEFTVTARGEDYQIKVATNSSITDFEFNETGKKLSISLDGKNGTNGETYLDIGTILVGDYDVLIDGEGINETDDDVKIIDDQTTNQTFISIIYTHSGHDITILGTNVVPEFPLPTILIGALGLLGVLIVSIVMMRVSKSRTWWAGVQPS